MRLKFTLDRCPWFSLLLFYATHKLNCPNLYHSSTMSLAIASISYTWTESFTLTLDTFMSWYAAANYCVGDIGIII